MLVSSSVTCRSCPVVNTGTAPMSHETCSLVATKRPTVVIRSTPPSLSTSVKEGSLIGARLAAMSTLHTTGETSPLTTEPTGVQSPNRPGSSWRLALGFHAVSASLLTNHVNLRFSPEGWPAALGGVKHGAVLKFQAKERRLARGEPQRSNRPPK